MAKRSPSKKHGNARKLEEIARKDVAISVFMSKKLANVLDELAEEKGWTRSKTVTLAVRQFIKTSRGKPSS